MNTDDTHQMLVKFLKKKTKVSFHPVFSLIAGSVTAGLMLSQLWYWSDGRGWHKDGWIWKLSDDWLRETSLTESEVEGAREKLLERGLIKYQRMGMPAKPHYLIQKDAILAAINALSYSFWSILMELDKSETPISSNMTAQKPESCLPEIVKQDCQKEEKLPDNNPDSGLPISGKLLTEITAETTSKITSETTTTTTVEEKCGEGGGSNVDFQKIDWPINFVLEDQQEILRYAQDHNINADTAQNILDEFRAAQANINRKPITNHIQWVESVMQRGVKRTTAGRAYSDNRRNSTVVKRDESKLPKIIKPRNFDTFEREIISQKALCKKGEL